MEVKKEMNSNKLTTMIMIVALGLVAMTLATGADTEGEYTATIDLQEYAETTDALVYSEEEAGLKLQDPYRYGEFETEPYFENVEGDVDQLSATLERYIDDQTVEIKMNLYDDEDTLIDDYLLDMGDVHEEDGHPVVDNLDPAFTITQEEYLTFEVVMER